MFKPYTHTIPACIRNGNPACPALAIIANKTVEHVSNLKGICNAFVHITDNNTTVYLDDKGNQTIIWNGPVTINDYDIDENPLNLRNQLLSTTINGGRQMIYFDAQKTPFLLAEGSNDYTILSNKPSINSVTLEGDKTLEELGIYQDDQIWGFDTIDDMKSATNLIAGSYAKTIGYKQIDDKGGCVYKIRNSIEGDVPNDSTIILLDNNLIAELIQVTEFLPINYEVVDYQGLAPVKTKIYYAIIPKQFKPNLYIANGTVGTSETAERNSLRNKTTLSINAGFLTGIVVANGVLRQEQLAEGDSRFDDIYMTSDGTLNSVNSFTSTEDIMALNPVWATEAWKPIVKDGVDLSDNFSLNFQPRTFIGQDSEGNYIVGVCGGRDYNEYGLCYKDIKNFCDSVNFNPYFLFNLDGGGSSAMTFQGQRVNRLVNWENRAVPSFIGFKSNFTKNDGIFQSNYTSSRIRSNLEASSEISNLLYSSDRIQTHEQTASLVTLDESGIYKDNNLISGILRFTLSGQINNYEPIITGLPCPRINNYQVEIRSINSSDSYRGYLVFNDDGVTSTLRNFNVSRIPQGSYYVELHYIVGRINEGINV